MMCNTIKLTVTVILLSLSGFAIADNVNWEQTVWADECASSQSEAYAQSEKVVREQARYYEAQCKNSGGEYSLKITYGLCGPYNPNSLFCNVRCAVFGYITCKYDNVQLEVGSVIQVIKDSDLYELTEVVGHVSGGEIFRVSKIEGDWISIEKLDGTPVKGWINIKNLKPRQIVEVIVDSDLYSGNQIVGHVKKGERYLKSKTQGNWVSLENLDGTVVSGWIKLKNLKIVR